MALQTAVGLLEDAALIESYYEVNEEEIEVQAASVGDLIEQFCVSANGVIAINFAVSYRSSFGVANVITQVFINDTIVAENRVNEVTLEDGPDNMALFYEGAVSEDDII